MRQLNRPVVIFALNTHNDKMRLALAGLKVNQYKQVNGVYKGQAETSYVVDMAYIDTVIDLALDHDQESILILNETRQAKLVFLKDMSEVHLGQFKAVPKHVALASDNLTWDSQTDTYYVVEAV